MPLTTLSLSVEEAAVERARRYVEQHDTSISELVNTILSKLPLEDDFDPNELPPITRRLYGVAAGRAEEDDYHRYLLEKYGA